MQHLEQLVALADGSELRECLVCVFFSLQYINKVVWKVERVSHADWNLSQKRPCSYKETSRKACEWNAGISMENAAFERPLLLWGSIRVPHTKMIQRWSLWLSIIWRWADQSVFWVHQILLVLKSNYWTLSFQELRVDLTEPKVIKVIYGR